INGFLDPRVAVELLNKLGIKVDFLLNSKTGIRLNSINSKTEDVHLEGELKFNISGVEDKRKELNAFFNGEQFDELLLPAGSIKDFESSFMGIKLPMGDEIENLELKLESTPVETFLVDLVMEKSSSALNDVEVLLYKSKYCFRINFNLGGIKLVLDYNVKEKTFQFTLKCDLLDNVTLGKRIFDFLYAWINDDSIKVIHDKDYPIKIPNIKDGFKEEEYVKELTSIIKFYYRFYSNIFKIQNYFGIKIGVPENISKEDIENIDHILQYINKESRSLDDVSFEIKITERDIFEENFLNKDQFAIRMVTEDEVVIDLFNKKINIGYAVAQAIDAYCENRDEVRQIYKSGTNIVPIIIKSTSGNLKFRYSEKKP
ncbi:MAG: abortive infection system toxin AbiGii family protein, partial [Candidatus Woesearchaeota archaeon]